MNARLEANRHRQDAAWKERPFIHHSPEETERAIRARAREVFGYLKAKPWTAGHALAETVREIRRTHSASIARSRASREAGI